MVSHHYHLVGSWEGGRSGQGSITVGGLQSPVSVPSEMKGQGIGTNPEELLLGSASTCYIITLGLMLNKREIAVKELSISSEGIAVEDPVLRFDRLIHRPVIVLENASEVDINRVERLAMEAEKNCMVSSAIRGNVEVSVESTVK